MFGFQPAALWGRGFCPAAGLPPGVVWHRTALVETTRTRLSRGAAGLPPGVAWHRTALVETTRTRLFRGAAGLPPGVAWNRTPPGETTHTRLSMVPPNKRIRPASPMRTETVTKKSNIFLPCFQ
jgi:hypothetical protein